MAALPSPLWPPQRAGRLAPLITGLPYEAPESRPVTAESLTLSSTSFQSQRSPIMEENKVSDKPGNFTEQLGDRG
jgi:hypothetical protein